MSIFISCFIYLERLLRYFPADRVSPVLIQLAAMRSRQADKKICKEKGCLVSSHPSSFKDFLYFEARYY